MTDLHCPNCGKSVRTEDAQWFGGEINSAAIFCCSDCAAIAKRFYDRANSELSNLLKMLKESIRIALAEGRLHYSEDPDQQVSKKDLLEAIVQLQEKKDAQRPGPGLGDSTDQPQAPGGSTKPVRRLGG